MVNAGDLFVCTVTGLALPLAMLDGFRALTGSVLPQQAAGLQIERRPLVWLLAIILGPGLFADRMLEEWRAGRLSRLDQANAMVITLGWAALYGFVVLGLTRAMLPA